jgi:hypothetical protein
VGARRHDPCTARDADRLVNWRRQQRAQWKRWGAIAGLAVALLLCWFAATDDVRVWPVRNTLQYHVARLWWALVGPPQPGDVAPGAAREGAVAGTVRDSNGRLAAGARVLLSSWDGTTYDALTGPNGQYAIRGVPAGAYAAVAGKPGYQPVVLDDRATFRWPWQPIRRVRVVARAETRLDVTLKVAAPVAAVRPGTDLRIGSPEVVESVIPIPARAVRRTVTFESVGRPNQLTLLYLPVENAPIEGRAISAFFPLLIAVYPGPADLWESASVPLVETGYAVIAVGPAYSFEIERDVDELTRLIQFARAGRLPGVDPTRIGVLGGSYSGLHVQQLSQRDLRLQVAVLMGAPADLFDMRRGLERGTFIPPFGLDRALIALGFPDREPRRYWRYSGAYHVHPAMMPALLIHSRSDDVVPYQQSELMAAELERVAVHHELHLLDGGSHYLLSDEADARRILGTTLTFLDRYLK